MAINFLPLSRVRSAALAALLQSQNLPSPCSFTHCLISLHSAFVGQCCRHIARVHFPWRKVCAAPKVTFARNTGSEQTDSMGVITEHAVKERKKVELKLQKKAVFMYRILILPCESCQTWLTPGTLSFLVQLKDPPKFCRTELSRASFISQQLARGNTTDTW